MFTCQLPDRWSCFMRWSVLSLSRIVPACTMTLFFPTITSILGLDILSNKVRVLHDTSLSRLTVLPEGKQVTSTHTAFQNEDNHKQRQRCQCLTDGSFINVSSMNWSGALSVGHWDKTALVTQKPKHCWLRVMVMPEWCSRELWSKQEQLRLKIWCLCQYTHSVLWPSSKNTGRASAPIKSSIILPINICVLIICTSGSQMGVLEPVGVRESTVGGTWDFL